MTDAKLASGVASHLAVGDHACHFFEDSADLSDLLIPFFKWGLEHNEAGIWVTGGQYGKERATSELRASVAGFDRLLNSGQMEIFGFEEWYQKCDGLGSAEVIQSWLSRANAAVARGQTCLRVTGHVPLMDAEAWHSFQEYEVAADAAFRGQPIVSICNYCRDWCSHAQVDQVLQAHDFRLARRYDEWHPTNGRNPPWSTSDIRSVLHSEVGNDLERVKYEGSEVALSRAEEIRLRMILRGLLADAKRSSFFSAQDDCLTVYWKVVANGSKRLRVGWLASVSANSENFQDADRIGSGIVLAATLAKNVTRTASSAGTSVEFEFTIGHS